MSDECALSLAGRVSVSGRAEPALAAGTGWAVSVTLARESERVAAGAATGGADGKRRRRDGHTCGRQP